MKNKIYQHAGVFNEESAANFIQDGHFKPSIEK
jgi:hypothetical protein